MTASPDPGPPRAPDPERVRAALHEAEAEARTRDGNRSRGRPVRGGAWPLLLALAVAGAGVAGWNVRTLRAVGAPLPAKRQRAELAGMMYVLTVQLDAVRGRTGSYPPSLDAVAPPLQGITYRREGDGYVLEGAAGEVTLTIRSGDDPSVLAILSGSAALGAGR